MNHNAVRQILLIGSLSGACIALAQTRPTTQYFYDANGNLTTAVDGLNRSTGQTYDTLNRLRRITQPKPTTAQPNPVIQFDYNGRDDLTRVIDPRNLTTSYTVNGFGDATGQLSPDTGATNRTFDAAGNLKTSTDARGFVTTFYYDAINRLNRVRYGDGTNTYYYYDEGTNGVGRLTRMVDPGSVTTTWTYDIQGRVLTRTQRIGSTLSHTLTYSYNATNGQLMSLTYPSGKVVTYAYGSSSKDLQTVRLDGLNVASSITYHPTGQLKQMTLGNGVVWRSTLDEDGRITSYRLNGVVYTLTWDAANRITAIKHASDVSWNRSFGYDDLDRITSFTSTPRSQAYIYDLTGNLTAKTDLAGGTTTNYTYGIDPASNRMTSIASLGIGYNFDAAGNRVSDNRISYTYNARGRMSRAVVTNGAISQTFNYLINGLEQRVRKTGPSAVVPQGTQIFVYDDEGRLLGEYDNLGRARIEHLWLEDRPVAAVTYTYVSSTLTPATTTVSYVEADHLGTPRMITNAAKQAVWLWHSAPYGDTFPNDNPSVLGVYTYNLRFPGQYFDKETNLAYNWHRDYEATSGRYVQSDPIGLYGGLNTFLYGNAYPLFYVDPHGLLGWADMPLLPDAVVNFAAGFGDTLSFNITASVRARAGIDGGVDKCSGAYGSGEVSAVGASLAFGAAHLGRNAWYLGGRNLAWDARSWGHIRDSWSLAAGGGQRWLRANGQSLHHWLIPQRFAAVHAGFNYFPISAGFNSWMNGSTATRVGVEWALRMQVLGIYGAPLTAGMSACECRRGG